MIPSSSGPKTVRAYFMTQTIVHLGLFSGQFLFAVLAYYLNSTGAISFDNQELNQMFLVIVPLVAIGAILGGLFLSKKQLESIKQKENLHEKLMAYQTVLIVKYGLLEGASILAIVGYLFTANTIFMAIAAVIILLFIMNRPTVIKTITDLELSQTERETVENPNAVLEE